MNIINNKYYIVFILFIIGFCSCKKENLPPLKCYDYSLETESIVSGETIDSILLHIEPINPEDGAAFDTTFINPPETFKYDSAFCGNFKYTLDVYHVKSTFGITTRFRIGSSASDVKTHSINGYTRIEDIYFFR